MVPIFPADESVLDDAAAHLAAGDLVAIPTETVYGLAANAYDDGAVAKIFLAKGRPSNNPLIVHVASVDRLDMAAAMPLSRNRQTQLDQVVDLWPGPLTVVLPAGKRVSANVTAGRYTVAVRVPSHPIANAILRRCDFPLAAPSANQSRYVSPTTAAHCGTGLPDSVAMVVDGGACAVGVESTIVKLDDDGPRLLRPGIITAETLAERFGVAVETLLPPVAPENDRVLVAPGMMREHYCPRTPLRLVAPQDDFAETVHPTRRVGRIAFSPLEKTAHDRYVVVETLSQSGDLSEVGRKLFAAIRQLDTSDVDLILVDGCEPTGIGRAIMDRLIRAAAGHPS
jgi:L-threonylcarbamoyladenylate synthase